MTIRRDLQLLSDEGKVLRTHGGAVTTARVSFEFRFLERSRHNVREKRQIGAVAAGLVAPGASVLLDSSTTTLAIARQLRSTRPLTIVTTSLAIAAEMFGQPEIDTLLLGGMLRKDTPDLFGALTEHTLERLRADVAFIGADAIGYDGWVYYASAEVAGMLERMGRAAPRRFIVADHDKIGGHQLVRLGHLRDWTGLITDDGISAAARRSLEEAGVRVMTAAGATAV